MGTNREKILLIGPPLRQPLTGGIANGIKMVLESDLKDKYEFILLNQIKKGENSSILLNLKTQFQRVLGLIIILVTKRPSLVHIKRGSAHNKRNLLTTLAHILLSKLFLRKVILQMHGSGFENYCNGEDTMGNILLRVMFTLSDRVIALTHYWKQNFLKIVPKNKIGVVPNGVLPRKLKSKEKARNNLGLNQNVTVLFFIGDLSRQKGVHDILESLPIIIDREHNILFICAGPYTDRNAENELKAIYTNAKIESYVAFLGVVWGDKKYDLFAASDIFIFPSYAENMPNSILEAMAAGLPVIASNIGAIPDLIKEGINGLLIKPGDWRALAQKTLLLVRDQNIRQAMGKNSIVTVQQKYDFKIVKEQLRKEYENLARV